jgi:hypothetical protein
MAHFAKIGLNGKVIGVHVVNNSDILNADGVEDETVGQNFLEKLHSWPSLMWIQTSYNTRSGKYYDNKTGELSEDQSKASRGNYAGIGYTWDEDNNLFYPKKPYPSWILNTTDARWHSPIGDAPDDLIDEEKTTHHYKWNESGQSWDKKEKST